MRDPGTPRRNPFFEHGADASPDDLGMGWRDHPGREERPSTGAPHSDIAAGGFATLLALVEGLGEAQPEAAEHLVAAAHEVVLTVKVLVDATEAVLAQQREAMRERGALRADAMRPEPMHSAPMRADATPVDPDASGDVSYLHRTEGP